MSPDEREELLAAHALGALPGPEAAEVEALVRHDPGAAEQVAVYREIADLIGVDTPVRPVDPALLERMLRSARRIQQSKRRRFPALRAAAMGVSLVVVAVLGGLVGARLDGGGTDPVVVPEVTPELGGAWPPPPQSTVSADGREVVIELRVWQHVEDPRDVWIQARPQGGSWETPAPVRFPLDETDGREFALWQFHSFRDLALEGAELRLWQRYRAPERIYVRACLTPCSKRDARFPDLAARFAETDWRRDRGVEEYWPWQNFHWSPLGMIPLMLDEGRSEFSGGGYRYGDLAVAVPVGNPGLAADREYLLALRDALAGTATLNWSASTPTSEWEGVRLTGWPRRVVGVDLADRGLDGEIWGWMGDLNELTELRLDGNHLKGTVPSKLAKLAKLTYLGLAGNELAGCISPPLRNVAFHDLARLGLPDCKPPIVVFEDSRDTGREGIQPGSATYRLSLQGGDYLVFDFPGGRKLTMSRQGSPFEEDDHGALTKCPPCHAEHVISLYGGLVVKAGQGNWLLLDDWSGIEIGRSHYEEDAPALSTLFEQVAASVWRHRSGDDDRGEWVWP